MKKLIVLFLILSFKLCFVYSQHDNSQSDQNEFRVYDRDVGSVSVQFFPVSMVFNGTRNSNYQLTPKFDLVCANQHNNGNNTGYDYITGTYWYGSNCGSVHTFSNNGWVIYNNDADGGGSTLGEFGYGIYKMTFDFNDYNLHDSILIDIDPSDAYPFGDNAVILKLVNGISVPVRMES